MAEQRLCSIPNCGKRVHGYGWCSAHYRRWRNHGDPLAGATPKGDARAFYERALAYDGDECLIWPYYRSRGYAMMGKQVVSRMVCIQTYGAPPTHKHQAAHRCGNGNLGCITKRHLSWKTPAGNSADMDIHGTRVVGERSNLAKLTAEQVRQIRSLKGRMTQDKIAAQFDITSSNVCMILSRKTWAHLG